MYKRIILRAPKLTAAAAAFTGKGGSVKLGSDDKFAQAAFEYIFERNTVDAPKRRSEIEEERAIAMAYDRFVAAGDREHDARLAKLIERMSEVLDSLPEALREEALLLNSQQPPFAFRRPTLTPPLASYEPAFGLDVPQLRGRVEEYPPVARADDAITETTTYPLVDPDTVRDIAAKVEGNLRQVHNTIRRTTPATGVLSEAWEAEVALQRKAIARQQLILKLCDDEDFREAYDTDEEKRRIELQQRGIVPLAVEEPLWDGEGRVPAPPAPLHYAQLPKAMEPRQP